MRFLIFSLVTICAINKIFAQDTIHFQNKSSQIVKVVEIGIDEIKYNRADNLTGPLYIANKNDIHFIKYANGHVDTFKLQTPIVNPITESAIISSGSPANTKIEVHGSKLRYMDKGLGEAKLFRVISAYPTIEKKSILLNEYKVMKGYKKKQYLFGFMGLGLGVALPYIGLIGTIISEEAAPVITGLSAGFALGVTGAVISGVNKHKRMKKKVEIAKIYNN